MCICYQGWTRPDCSVHEGVADCFACPETCGDGAYGEGCGESCDMMADCGGHGRCGSGT